MVCRLLAGLGIPKSFALRETNVCTFGGSIGTPCIFRANSNRSANVDFLSIFGWYEIFTSKPLDILPQVWTIGGMTFNQIITHWGGVDAARKALGLSRQTLYNWRDKGIPLEAQVNVEVVTEGKLKADLPQMVRS